MGARCRVLWRFSAFQVLTRTTNSLRCALMKPNRRHIRLTYVATGESALAEMLEDEAPNVCKHVWEILPVETKVIHGMYSGAEVFAMLDNPQPVPNENMVQLALPGELLYFYDPSTGAVGAKKPVAELVIVYGRGV